MAPNTIAQAAQQASAGAAPNLATPGGTPAPNFMQRMQQVSKMMGNMQKIQSLMGGGPGAAPPAAPAAHRPQRQRSAQSSEILASAPDQMRSVGMDAMDSMIPSVGGPSMMPASVGIGTIPVMGQPMDSRMMTAGLGPNQQGAVNDYLRSQGMVGFV
jgi:hypothetical protein